jgi:hypothetical protein
MDMGRAPGNEGGASLGGRGGFGDAARRMPAMRGMHGSACARDREWEIRSSDKFNRIEAIESDALFLFFDLVNGLTISIFVSAVS